MTTGYVLIGVGLLLLGAAVGGWVGNTLGWRSCDRMWEREAAAWTLDITPRKIEISAQPVSPAPTARPLPAGVDGYAITGRVPVIPVPLRPTLPTPVDATGYIPRHGKPDPGPITAEFTRIVEAIDYAEAVDV